MDRTIVVPSVRAEPARLRLTRAWETRTVSEPAFGRLLGLFVLLVIVASALGLGHVLHRLLHRRRRSRGRAGRGQRAETEHVAGGDGLTGEKRYALSCRPGDGHAGASAEAAVSQFSDMNRLFVELMVNNARTVA